MQPLSEPTSSARLPHWLAVSPKEQDLSRVLLERTEGPVHTLLTHLLADDALRHAQAYANVVAVRRLGYNDHGPVHARLVTYNALKLLRLLHEAGVQTSIEQEEVGTYEDAQVAVALAAFLHDIGMGVARQGHETHAVVLCDDKVRHYLGQAVGEGSPTFHVLRGLVHEGILGHMATLRIHSLEAGVVLVADGTDMARGRSRVPQLLDRDPVVGDMHRFSAGAIARVDIGPGEHKPVRILATMENVTGLYQIEEVLMTKLKASPIMPFVELAAVVGEGTPRYYLK